MTRAWFLAVLLTAGCAEAPKLETGDRCTLTTECASPLVCRLERCRRECATTRDCPAGSSCVVDERGFGACTLEAERECTRASDCPTPLVCRFGQCSNPCGTHEDCPAGALCINAKDGTGTACVDMDEAVCEINSDCPLPLICAVDNRCREECHTDRDCRDGNVCIGMSPNRVCGRPGMDAGAMDAGTMDSGMDGGPDAGTDAGPADAPLSDPGLDAGMPDAGTDAAMMMPIGRALVLVALGSMHGCRVSGTGALECWGDNVHGQIGDGTVLRRMTAVPVLPGGVIEATGGGQHTCAIDGMGLQCWGDNLEGQLGDGTTVEQHSPTRIATTFTPVRVEAGARNTCAIDDAGGVWCWGDNEWGQVGDGTVVDPRSSPRPVALPMATAQIAVGSDHVCALLIDGTVSCWGKDEYGQLGNGMPGANSSTPVAVPGLTGIVEIASGSHHTCARRAAGTVICWGDDGYAQLGDGTEALPGIIYQPATDVVGLGDAVELGAGIFQTCARRAGGTVQCWGSNVEGQVGLDPFAMLETEYPTPQTVTGLTGALELGVGEHHGCVRRATDHRCWGRGREGQLGNGGMTNQWNHVQVLP